MIDTRLAYPDLGFWASLSILALCVAIAALKPRRR